MKKIEEYIFKIAKKYQKVLLLDDFMLKVHKTTMTEAYMTSKLEFPYKTISVGYSLEAEKDFNKGESLRDTIIHELCHAITDPLYVVAVKRYLSQDEIEDRRETLTDHIANIIIKNNL